MRVAAGVILLAKPGFPRADGGHGLGVVVEAFRQDRHPHKPVQRRRQTAISKESAGRSSPLRATMHLRSRPEQLHVRTTT